MIQLNRDRNQVPPSFVDPGRHARLLELFRAARDGTLSDTQVKERLFSSSRWNGAKRQLAAETSGKCAFCETPTSAAYYGDVEHFRPKARYWWLAYCYDNYLYSCRVCNGKKSDQHIFAGPPLAPPGVPPTADDAALLQIAITASPNPSDNAAVNQLLTALNAEAAPLPNPYIDNPEALFAWEADDVLREVWVVARPGHARAQAALNAAEQILGINRDELKVWRWRTYSSLSRLRRIAEATTGQARQETLDMLRELASGSFPYSAMVRYFAHERWQLI